VQTKFAKLSNVQILNPARAIKFTSAAEEYLIDGFNTYVAPSSISLVQWPERAPSA